MTNLTVAEVYAIGLPIIYGMIALEAIFSSITNKSNFSFNSSKQSAHTVPPIIQPSEMKSGIFFVCIVFIDNFSNS